MTDAVEQAAYGQRRYGEGRLAEREQIRAGIEALAGRADAEEGRDYFEFTDVSPDGKPIEVRALAVDTVLALIDAREEAP